MLFTYLMLGGLILLLAPQSLTGKLQLGFVRVFRWPLSMGGGFPLTAQTQQTFEDMVPRTDYVRLRNHCDNLEQTLAEQRKRYGKYYALHNAYVWEGTDFVIADVITANISQARGELTVSYGKSTGLVKGQYVLGDNSVIGTISDFSSGTAHVKLFTDPTSKMPVRIGKSLERIMQGNGNNTAKIPLLRKEHNIRVGDKVYASNKRPELLDGVYVSKKKLEFLDASMIVGTVVAVKPNRRNPLELDVTVKPACDIEKLEDIAVIVMNPRK